MKRTQLQKVQKLLHGLWLVSSALQALWMFMLYSGWIVNSRIIYKYLDLVGAAENTPSPSYEIPSFIAQPLVIIVVIIILFIMVLILSRAPKTAAHVTIQATAEATKTIEPVVRRTIPKKVHTTRPWYVSLMSQIVLSSIVFVVTIPMHFVTREVGQEVLWTISTSLWMLAVGILVVSLLLRRVSRLT